MSHRLLHACRGLAAAGALLCALAPGAARAGAEERPSEDAGQEVPAPRLEARASPALSDEDREVVENLELLQAMEAAEDLELLLELGADGDQGDD